MADTSQARATSGIYDNVSARTAHNELLSVHNNEVKTPTRSEESGVASTRTAYGGYHYGTVTYQLRTAQLVANGIGAMCLYSEADRMGLGNFLFPVIFLLAEIFVVGKRWYHSIDGRFDFKQMLSVGDSSLKIQYAFNVFGGFVLAMMVHWMTAEVPSALSSLLFHLTDYLAIVAAFAALALDLFEGAKEKFA